MQVSSIKLASNRIQDSNKVNKSNSVYSSQNLLNNIDSISFKETYKSAKLVSSYLKSRYNIESEFSNNSFVAQSIEKTVNIFSRHFGDKSLTNTILFIPFSELKDDSLSNALGFHTVIDKNETLIAFNADESCFKTIDKLKFNEKIQKLLWWHPTGHYLQTFVHEFGHSAHYRNLCRRGNEASLDKLRTAKIPTAIGKLITKFKLGRYAATNLNEFMAERITKDICKNLNDNDEYIGKFKDLDYSNIFYNRWKYRYSSPQSYLDYFTQQIWNGDIEKAEAVAGKVEEYLKELETVKVAPVVTKVANTVQKTSQTISQKIETAVTKPKLTNMGEIESIFINIRNEIIDTHAENEYVAKRQKATADFVHEIAKEGIEQVQQKVEEVGKKVSKKVEEIGESISNTLNNLSRGFTLNQDKKNKIKFK